MPIKLAVPTETQPGESRVALVPAVATRLAEAGVEVLIQTGAGAGSRIPDSAFVNVTLVGDASELLGVADVVFKVQPPTENEIDAMREGACLVGFMAAWRYPERVARMRDRKLTSFAMELVPRISRAQSMDALSSQASVAGYKSVLMAASLSGRFFPMLTTAAGTIRPSRVLILGAGVAGLQAIATARRLGAIVEAYDVRSETREQVESLGAKFVELSVDAKAEGGYARELTDEEKAQQQAALADVIAQADAVITTAAVPGRPAPRLITAAMVEGMKPGAVLVDLAAESGGNCELTRAGETINHGNVVIHGPVNVPAQMPVDSSEMYARNLLNFITPMLKDGELAPDWDDAVVAGSLLTRDGAITNEATRKLVDGEAS